MLQPNWIGLQGLMDVRPGVGGRPSPLYFGCSGHRASGGGEAPPSAPARGKQSPNFSCEAQGGLPFGGAQPSGASRICWVASRWNFRENHGKATASEVSAKPGRTRNGRGDGAHLRRKPPWVSGATVQSSYNINLYKV